MCNALSGNPASEHSRPRYGSEQCVPTLRLVLWHAWRAQGGKDEARRLARPSQSPSRSIETARPGGRASALKWTEEGWRSRIVLLIPPTRIGGSNASQFLLLAVEESRSTIRLIGLCLLHGQVCPMYMGSVSRKMR